MAWCLFRADPLSKPVMMLLQWYSIWWHSVKSEKFHWRKCFEWPFWYGEKINLHSAVHETSSSPFAQFDLILGWTTWKWLWATWNYNEMLKQPICERIGHGWRFHALHSVKKSIISWMLAAQYIMHIQSKTKKCLWQQNIMLSLKYIRFHMYLDV